MSDGIDSLIKTLDARDLRARTVVPGLVDEVEPNSPDREQIIDFRIGTADLTAGEPEDLGIAPSVPMLSIGSGGFFFLMPAAGEALALVGDRASGLWRANKTPGEADPVNGKRTKVLADAFIAPLQFTAPAGAPADWEDRSLIGGPAGVAIDIDDVGTITITKQGDFVATISMTPDGSVTIDVGSGKAVNIGDMLAVALTKWPQLLAAVNAMLAAGVAAVGLPGDPLGTNSVVGFTAAQGAWATAIGIGSPACTKAKGS